MLRLKKLARVYKKKKEPLKYEVAFDGIKYTKEEQSYLWQQLVKTLIKLHQESLQN